MGSFPGHTKNNWKKLSWPVRMEMARPSTPASMMLLVLFLETVDFSNVKLLIE